MSDLYMSYKILESNEMHFKTCTKCGETLPATTEYFHKKKTGKYGLSSICKKCALERVKQYNKDNKDKIAKYKKQWYEDNKDKLAEQHKQYYEDNKDKIAEYHKQYHKQWYKDNKDKKAKQHKQWYKDNKDKIAERNKQYREDNKDKIAEYHKQYYEDNKDKILEQNKQYHKQYYSTPQGQVVMFNYSCKRRTKEQNQGNGITKEEWLEMMKYFDWKCAYSGKPFKNKTRTIDHIKPLNQGGEHEIWNVVPMDRGLNSSKQDKDMEEWYQEQDFYSEERLQKIYEWQEYAYNKYSKK